MFKGFDKSLYLEEITEELEGIEQRKYLSIQGSTDPSRAEFENLATEAGLALNLPPDVDPFQHFCDEFRKDQQENNPDYRPGEEERVLTWIVKNGEEIKKEHRAELVECNKAIREAEGVTDKDTSIDSPTVFGKAVEIASRHGVSSQFFLDLKQEKHVEKSTKTICTVPNAGQAAAAFCSRLARRAWLEAKATEATADNQEEQPVSPKDTPECNTWQKKLDDPKKYPWMTILETQEALGGISNSRVYALKDEGVLQVLADIKPIRITTESVILLMEGKSDKIA